MLRSLDDDNEALEAVKLLVGYGCNPLEVNSCGKTPLCVTVQLGGHLSVARYLLTLGALLPPDLLLVTWEGHCRWSRRTTPDIIHFLVENGVDVLACDRCGRSVLHIALLHFYDDNTALEMAELLVGHGCDPLQVDSCGDTPLLIAVGQGYVSVARYLLTLGAHLPPDLLVTLKHYRWGRSTSCMIRFLVENGANALAHTSNGDSILHVVLQSLYDGDEALKAVKSLVGYGCNPLEANSRGNTPLHIAVEQNHLSVARYLLTLGIPLPPDLLVTLDLWRFLESNRA